MSPIYYVIIIAISVIALTGTLMVAKQMTKVEKELTSEDEIESLKNDGKNSSIPLLSIIYAITAVITVILVWIFIF
ncbi:hypothetical protein HM131_17035 [Halobacillus mangrovi]|uniref:Uncharacterized protein n=2 Tax=Halobacillus mangrovi TaxID=402384 RepID=A0A1W6A162_9BACI|nr:hypothetical protein HM131_17035 [Halobacillus mangrovi]